MLRRCCHLVHYSGWHQKSHVIFQEVYKCCFGDLGTVGVDYMGGMSPECLFVHSCTALPQLFVRSQETDPQLNMITEASLISPDQSD